MSKKIDHSVKIGLELLAQSVELSEPMFSFNGEFLSFILKENDKSNIILYDLENREWGRRKITFSKFPEPSALYGGGGYSWVEYNGEEAIVVANKEGLWRIKLSFPFPEALINIKLNTSCPSASKKGKIFFSTLLSDTMALMSIDSLEKQWPIQEIGGINFIIDPVISPSEKFLACHAWDFPYMSWDYSFIVLKNLEKKEVTRIKWEDSSVSQPKWSNKHDYLAFLSDKSGWLNLWLLDDPKGEPRQLVDSEEEHGYPTWVCRNSSFVWMPDDDGIIFVQNKNALTSLKMVNIEDGEVSKLDLPSGGYSGLSMHPSKKLLAFIYTNYYTPPQLRIYNLETKEIKIIEQGFPHVGSSVNFVKPSHFSFPTTENQTAYALMWKPVNTDIENAPIIVNAHGGPTSQRLGIWNPQAQFFTHNGFLYLELNYRGSTGYGRKYAQSLNGYWGERDTEDAISLLDYLENKGFGNTSKAVILGGSAGGFLVLNVLTKYPDSYAGGIAWSPVTDLFHLSKSTHYFESHYTDMLVGPLPEFSEKYRENSPLFHASRIKRPLLVIQGEEDPVVPIEQVNEFVENAKASGAPISYKVFPDEKHGIKKHANRLEFYKLVLDFIEKNIL